MHNTYSYIKYKKENEYLAHHGILGQKWGKKNGPPYPLDPEDHSAAEKKEHHGHYSQGVTQDRGGSSSGSGYSSGAQNEPQNGKKQIDKKKILKAAAITAGVMTVVGGTSIGVALAVKEPEVFSNAFNDIKSTILQKSSADTREDTFNNLKNKDSAQVEARRIHDEATARREERSRDDFRKSMNEGFRNSSSEAVKEARAEADASEKQQKGRREEFKEKVNNFIDAYKEHKAQKNAEADNKKAREAMGKLKEKQNISDALNRLRNGNYSSDDAGQDQRQSDYNLLYDKDPRGLSSIMDEARSKMGKNQSEQTSNWAKMENTKRMQDKQNDNARKNAKQYEKDHPTTKFGKAKQKVEKAAAWVNKTADTVNRTTGTVYKVKGTYDNVMRVAGMVGGIGTAVGAVSAANKRKQQQQQQQQYQQQGGYQDNINPQYQQQTQQFKKKKR